MWVQDAYSLPARSRRYLLSDLALCVPTKNTGIRVRDAEQLETLIYSAYD